MKYINNNNKMDKELIEKICDEFGYPIKVDLRRTFKMVTGRKTVLPDNDILSIQECNMGGEYLRCFYVQDDEIYYFIESTNFLKDRNYISSEVDGQNEYILMWAKN